MSKKYKVEVCYEDYVLEAETADEAWDLAHQLVEIVVSEIEEEDDE